MAPNFGVISPLVETVDRRGSNFSAGLGDASISEELSFAKGLQSGMISGAQFESITSETRRLNDPEKLAQEALNRQLANIALEKQIETATINNDTLDERNKAIIANTQAGTGLTVAQTEGVKVKTDLEKRFGAADIQSQIGLRGAQAMSARASAGKTAQETAILREVGVEAERAKIFKDITAGYKDLAGKEDEAGAVIPGMPSGFDFDAPSGAASPTAYKPGSGVLPSGDAAAAPAGETPIQRLQRLTADRQAALTLNQNIQDQLTQKNAFAMGIDATELAIKKSQEQYNQTIAAKRNFNDLVTAGEQDRDFEGTPNYAVGIPKLLQLGEQVKRLADAPEQRDIVSNYITEGLKAYGGAQGFIDYVDTQVASNEMSPDQGKALKSAIFGSVARSVSPEQLPGEQKNLLAAGFGIEHIEDPEKTYDMGIQALQGDTAGIDDPMFKKLTRNNDYFNAAREASKWGKQPFKIVSADAPPNPNQTDVAGQGVPQKAMKFIGADGTVTYGPDPKTDADFAMLDILEKVQTRQATIAGTKVANTQMQQGIEQNQQDVQAAQPRVPVGQPATAAQRTVAANTFNDVVPEGVTPTAAGADVAAPQLFPTPEAQVLGQIRQGQATSSGLINQEQQLLAGQGPGSAAGAAAGQMVNAPVNGQAGPATVSPVAAPAGPRNEDGTVRVEEIPAGGAGQVKTSTGEVVQVRKSFTGDNIEVTKEGVLPNQSVTTYTRPPNDQERWDMAVRHAAKDPSNKNPQVAAKEMIKGFEAEAKPYTKEIHQASKLVRSAEKRAKKIDKLIERVTANGNEQFLSLLGQEFGNLEKYASAIRENPAAAEDISLIKQIEAEAVLDNKIAGGLTGGMLNTEKEAVRWISALFSGSQDIGALKIINEQLKKEIAREKEVISLGDTLFAQGPTVLSVDQAQRIVREYINSPASDVEDPDNYRKADQFLGHDVKNVPINTPVPGGRSGTSSPLDKAVPSGTTASSSSTTSSGSASSTSSSSSSAGGPPPELKQAAMAEVQTIQDKASTTFEGLKDLQTKLKTDPELQSMVTQAKKVLRDSGEDPEFVTQALRSLTPEVIQNFAEKLRGGMDTLASKLADNPEQFKKEMDAIRLAQEELFQEAGATNPWESIAAQASAFMIAQSAIKGVGLKAVEALANKIPAFQKALDFAKISGPLVGNIAVDVAANRATSPNADTEQDALVALFSIGGQGLAAGASALASSKVGQTVAHWFKSPSAEKAMADILAAKGVIPEGVTAQGISKSMQRAIDEGLNPLAYLDGTAREVAEEILRTPAGQTMLKTMEPQIKAANQAASEAAERASGLSGAKSVGEIERAAKADINATIERVAGSKAAVERLNKNNALGNIVSRFKEGKATAQETIDNLTTLASRESTNLDAVVGKAGGSPEAILGQRIKDIDAVQEVVTENMSPSFRKLEVRNQKLRGNLGDKIVSEFTDRFGVNAQKLVDKVYTQIEGVPTAKQGSNSFKFLAELRQNAKTGANGEIKTSLQQTEGMLKFLDDKIDEALEIGGEAPKTFSNFLDEYGNAAEVTKALDVQKNVYREIQNEITNAGIRGGKSNLTSKLYGSADKAAEIDAAFGKLGSTSIREQVAAFDNSVNVLDDIAQGKRTKDLIGLSDDIEAARGLIEDSGVLGEKLVTAKNPEVIKQVKNALSPKAQELVEQSGLRYMKDQLTARSTTTRATQIGRNTDEQILAFTGIDKNQYDNLLQMISPEKAKLLESFFGKKTSIAQLESLMETTAAGTPAKRTILETIGWRRALETQGKIMMDVAASSMFNSLKKAEQQAIVRMMLDPDPAKAVQFWKDVTSMIKVKPTKAGIEAVAESGKAVDSTALADSVRGMLITVWGNRSRQSDSIRELRQRNANRDAAIEALKKAA